MYCVGLTGGIGSGKSTVARILESFGAIRIDTDGIARHLLAPGGALRDDVVAAFGSSILSPSGALDREALAQIVFRDESEREKLNAIVHPFVRKEVLQRIAEVQDNSLVIVEVPLLQEGHHGGAYPFHSVVVIDCDESVAFARIARSRDLSDEDIRLRIASQATREERRAIADIVFDNTAEITSDKLRKRVKSLSDELSLRANAARL